MKAIKLSTRVLGYPIAVTAIPAGRDWSVTIIGGCTPHIGSVSLAEYEDAVVVLRTISRESHKDQVISDRIAHQLASKCKGAVCVACGIHYDGPSHSDLEHIISRVDELLENLYQRI